MEVKIVTGVKKYESLDELMARIEIEELAMPRWKKVLRNIGWWFEDLPIKWCCLIDGITNIIEFLPVVWKDRDWDCHFLLDLMKFKLIRMRDRTIKIDRFITSLNNAKYMNTCIKLIDIVNEGVDDKFGNDFEAKFKYEDKAKALLFKILYKKIEGWWD